MRDGGTYEAGEKSPQATEPDWSALVRGALSGSGKDEQGITALIEAAQPRLFRFCMFLTGNAPRAEDLCQESLVRALENLKKLRDPAQFLSWMFKMAKNAHIDQTRSPRNRETQAIEELEEKLGQDPQQETMVQVRQVLSQLETEERLVLLLVDMEERSYLEAAEIIGISEAAVRSRLHRARLAFEKKFSGA